MKFITELLKYFVYITTGILFVFITIMLIEGDESISIQTLVQIPCAALVTALVTEIFIILSRAAVTKKEFYIGISIHYILLCVTMVIFGTAFGWVNFNLAGVMIIVVSTAAIYAFTFAGAYLSSKSEAEKLNKALKSKREQKK